VRPALLPEMLFNFREVIKVVPIFHLGVRPALS
jgi:hypothetical protein